MLWRELIDLEPDLLEIEAWVRTLDPDDPHVLDQIKARLCSVVGWGREIPGVEIVPFDGPWPGILDKDEHDRFFGNDARKHRLFSKVPVFLRVLHTSEAWDAAVHYMTIIMRAMRRERLAELGSTGHGEPPRSSIMDMFGTEENHGTGYMTIGQLSRALKGKPATAFIYICVDGKTRRPVVEARFEKSEAADEGGAGEFILVGDGVEGE